MSIMTGRSQQERLWMIAGGLAALVLLLIGWAFFISPQRSSTASGEIPSQQRADTERRAGNPHRRAAAAEQQDGLVQAAVGSCERGAALDERRPDVPAFASRSWAPRRTPTQST